MTDFQFKAGITPAGAGKTVYAGPGAVVAWDHPRRCGENKSAHGRLASLKGSPPQVRGKRPIVIADFLMPGITPAGAGKTRRQGPMPIKCWDHPRRCGENTATQMSTTRRPGSPPQVRGKPEGISKYGDYGRITPAGAGKTRWYDCRNYRIWDHPRRCGENACG